MRRETKIALGLGVATLAGVGLAAWVAARADRGPVLGTADAVAIRDLDLRQRPDRTAPAVAFIAAGSPVRIEQTAAPGWIYVYQPLGTGVVLEGYVPSTDLASPSFTTTAARPPSPELQPPPELQLQLQPQPSPAVYYRCRDGRSCRLWTVPQPENEDERAGRFHALEPYALVLLLEPKASGRLTRARARSADDQIEGYVAPDLLEQVLLPTATGLLFSPSAFAPGTPSAFSFNPSSFNPSSFSPSAFAPGAPGAPTRGVVNDILSRPAPRLALPWLAAPIGFLTGELPRGVAVDMLVAEADAARQGLDEAFRRQTGGPALSSQSTYRSFDDQANIVASVLNRLGVGPAVRAGDDDAIRRGLLANLQTRSIPGFSRHHWGSDVDVLSTDSAAWRAPPLTSFVAPLDELAPAHGLYHPYVEGRYPEPAKPHYSPEPWHLSLIGPGEAIRQRWLREIGDDPAQLSALLDRAASAIATRAGLDVVRTRAALGALDLTSYVRNVAPAPVEVV